MGKTFLGSHKPPSSKGNPARGSKYCNLVNIGGKLKSGSEDERNAFSANDSAPGCRGQGNGGLEKVPGLYVDTCRSLIKNDSCDVWCICRLVKPCQSCRERRQADRDSTPTPEDNPDIRDPGPEGSGGSTKSSATPTSTGRGIEVKNREHSANQSVVQINVEDFDASSSSRLNKTEIFLSGFCSTEEINASNGAENGTCVNGFELSDTRAASDCVGINLVELFQKLDKLNAAHEELETAHTPGEPRVADTPPGTPSVTMDTASVCSALDNFDFDTSFCSLKSTDLMDPPGDLTDQLALVQQMVVEMKTGFTRAMEELSKIQYGDQTLQQQLADNTQQCHCEITSVSRTVQDLKGAVERLSGKLDEVSEAQIGLQEKLDTYQTDKTMLLEELERSGALSEQARLRLCGSSVQENNNTIPPEVGPMVHPYLNSLQHMHRDSSLTAAVSRSLNLTQALGEKCLNLDLSTTSSDDEDNSRHSRSRSGSSHRAVSHQRKFQYEDSPARPSQKIPPHEQFLGEVRREEAVRDMVEVEREYCGQLWALMEDFMNPLRDETIMARREFSLLFPPYIPHLYEQHCIILRKLEERVKKWKHGGVIGDVFAKFTESQDGEGLMLYKDFINDFPTIINTMNKWFAHSPHFRELMQSQYLANAPVLQLLLAPLQQIPKYSLLLKSLLKATSVDHPDRYYLESSLARLKQFLTSMNDDLEQAMMAINGNGQHVKRVHEAGISARSKSSASSGEVNPMSRDSGIHSNEEERAKSPMSPNSSRRYLLQMLREKREHRAQEVGAGTPRGKKTATYSSNPDLPAQLQSLQDGRMSPHLASLPQSRMFSSLSKLPLPRENSTNRRSRSRKQPEQTTINPHYLRPLTPQVLQNSKSAHNFDSSMKREEYAERMRQRPQSAMEFSYRGRNHGDEYLDLLAHQASLAISPPHSSSSDRSRQELQMSLQKLLAETNNLPDDYSDHEHDLADGHVSYHKQFLATKNKIQKHKQNMAKEGVDIIQDDFGIYGDDDEDDNDIDDTQQEVKPMKLLTDSHRPKIMVPRWRQNTSPQPPSYNQSVAAAGRKPGNTEANLAASLAQSLFDTGQQHSDTLPKEKRGPDSPRKTTVGMHNASHEKGSLKRKSKTRTADSPRRSPVRQSPVPCDSTSKSVAKSLSFDTAPNRPSNLPLKQNNNANAQNQQQSASSTEQSDNDKPKRNSVTKLSDVIAYTADCLEKKELVNLADADSDSDSEEKLERVSDIPGGKLSVSDILANHNMKVSSVDVGSSGEMTGDEMDKGTASDKQRVNGNNNSKNKADTDSVVFYFQHRDQINKGNTESHESQRSPTFINTSMDKTSTPKTEYKPLPTNSLKDGFGNFSKKETGRRVRSDEAKPEAVINPSDKDMSQHTSRISSVDSTCSAESEASESSTKERVLKAVDQLRMSFERKKQLTEERRQSQSLTQPRDLSSPTSPTSTVPIQKHFNDLSLNNKGEEQKSPVMKSFSTPVRPSEHENGVDQLEQKHGMYFKKTGQTKLKYQSETASARQIQHKMERAASPTGRTPSPINLNSPYEKFKTQVEASNLAKPKQKNSGPLRNSFEGSLIPKRSKSPTRSSAERERPKSSTDFLRQESKDGQNKNSTKETKIPVLKKASGGTLSKSSEDISKLKKKSAFKDQLKHIFGRKKKKSKLYSCNGYDPDEEYNNHVTIATEPSFQHTDDDEGFFPLRADRRANSASHILQNYQFEENDPVSAV
ncbi:uncharacterized protein LOC128208841 isoform X2 [Mya arenaria]|uniref:uncharacterized protein LOC128208841 isoform X2 n=1 Tax=Mya arenaria TaxID=6604 RepID=UPI0022E775A2|nr:uncharacterized protein LOC128208841 isoform X2 [Mya arenaria]